MDSPSTLSLAQLIELLNAERFKGVDTDVIGINRCPNGDLVILTADTSSEAEILLFNEDIRILESGNERLKLKIERLERKLEEAT